jgi:hypothetical protein
MITLQILFPRAIIKYMKFLTKGQTKFGSSLLLPAYGWAGQGQYLLFWRCISQSKIRNSAAAKARAGWEFIFPTPLFLPAPPERSVLVSAARSAAIIRDFAQKRFALRPVIATRCNFYNFWGNLISRSPRLRLGSLRKFLYILGLNQRGGQNQKRFFYPAGGGLALRSNAQNENFVSNFFLSAKGGIRSQFFTFIAKGDLLKIKE